MLRTITYCSDAHWCVEIAEIGVGLTAFGLLFTVLGVLFFFDRGLLAMGNVSAQPRRHHGYGKRVRKPHVYIRLISVRL